MEGDFFNNSSLTFSADIQHFVDGSTTKYRTGWLDCQVKKASTFTSVANGAGCAKNLSSGTVFRYMFGLEGLSSSSSLNPISKIYYRIGLKNADAGGDRKNLESVYINYTFS